MARNRRTRYSFIVLLVGAATVAAAGPTVVPTCEGQLGETPVLLERLVASRFESIRGSLDEVIFADLRLTPSIMGPTPGEVAFFDDFLHSGPSPTELDSTNVAYQSTFQTPPRTAQSRNAANTGDFVFIAATSDGTTADTQRIDIQGYDDNTIAYPTITLDNIPTFPDPTINNTGIAVDNQGRVTVAYTEIFPGNIPRTRAARFDGLTGLPINVPFDVSGDSRASADIALLDPAGSRVLIPNTDFGTIRGNILDLSGPAPLVLPEFPISTTPALFANMLPAVASDPATGTAIAVWENVSALVGDPVNIRGRRFDADGNPIGTDFRVNTTTANAQGQASAAMQDRIAAVVWAGDAAPGDELDVFLQVYDADGNPIGGEVPVNTTTAGVQDQPAVRFLPEPDAQGRPQFVVNWRDVANANGSTPNGTGTSYRCFSIEGLGDPTQVFADGFESGDTSSWGTTNP